MRSRATEVFIGLGSNIEPEKHIRLALKALSGMIDLLGISTFYETEPLLERKQDAFLNGVLRAATVVSARELKFEVLRPLETRLGRVRGENRAAPRTIDLDILLFGEEVVSEEALEIPDPDIYRRAFLARPLAELKPGLHMPDSGWPVARLAHGFSGDSMKPCAELTQRLRREFLNIDIAREL